VVPAVVSVAIYDLTVVVINVVAIVVVGVGVALGGAITSVE